MDRPPAISDAPWVESQPLPPGSGKRPEPPDSTEFAYAIFDISRGGSMSLGSGET